MSDSAPNPDSSYDPPRTRRQRQQQQQQSASQPHGIYPPSHTSDPDFSTTGFPAQYSMSQPTSSYTQLQIPHQYIFPQLSIPQIAPSFPPTHSHPSPVYYSSAHSATPSQPPLILVYAPSFHTTVPLQHSATPSLAFAYEGARNSGPSPSIAAGSPYSSQPPFPPITFHPTLTETPQFTHAPPFSSPLPAQHAQQSQLSQYPPAYVTRTIPTVSEDARQPQQPPWWFIPPHSVPTTAGLYPSMYYVDTYGNPSDPALGQGLQSLPSPSASRPLYPPAFSHREPPIGSGPEPGSGIATSGPHRPSEGARKSDLVIYSSSQAPLSPSPFGLGESASERGHQQQQMREAQSRQDIRRSRLPNPAVKRSEWVMWIGNIPSDATHNELWRFFTRPVMPRISSPVELPSPYHYQPQHSPYLPTDLLSPSGSSLASDADAGNASGVQSVFLIARSNCAFVNYISAAHLAAAVPRSNGIQLRPGDPRCPRLVCHIRRKEEDLTAGVGAQRGTGIHTSWVRNQREREQTREVVKQVWLREGGSTDVETSASEPPRSAVLIESGKESPAHGPGPGTLHHSDSSGGATTSSFLEQHFPKRYFILKSLTQDDLDMSVETGGWATQPHNETVLNQAFRNSTDVFLIFSVNRSGEFFGYARMASLMGKAADCAAWASRTNPQYSQHSQSPAASPVSSVAGKGSQVNEMNPEENEGSLPEGRQGFTLKRKERETENEKSSSTPFSPSDNSMAVDLPQPAATQKQLTSAEEVSIGKLAISSAGWYTAPLSERDHDMSKYSPIQSGPSRSLTRPTPTSSPEVMHSKITNPRIEGLREATDLRLISHPGEGEGQPKVIDRVKRRDAFYEPVSSSGSNPADSTLSLSSADLQSASGYTRRSSRAQGELETQGEDGDSFMQWGSPFKVQWIRVEKLPFTRTRHLRNPWNHKREVKVSRDGTELEPSVGQALLDEWDKEEPPGPNTAQATGGVGSASPASASAVRRRRRSALHRGPQPRAQTSPVAEVDHVPWSSQIHV